MRERTQRIHKHTDLCGSAAASGWSGRRQFGATKGNGADAPGKHTRAATSRVPDPSKLSARKGTNRVQELPLLASRNGGFSAKKQRRDLPGKGPRRRGIELSSSPVVRTVRT